MKQYFFVTMMVCAGAASGCSEKISTAPDLGFRRINPRTVEVVIPFEDFVDEVKVFGGYGSTADLRYGVIAVDPGGLNASTLAHLQDFPADARVPGTDGVTRTDTNLSFVGGFVVIQFDTVSGTVLVPAAVVVSDVKEDWHVSTVTWDVAVDTAGERRPWTQPGGGPTTVLGQGTYDAFIGRLLDDDAGLVDTMSIAIDSATVAALGDPASGIKGLLVSAVDPGTRLNVLNVSLSLTTVPSTRPDTILDLPVLMEDLVLMVDPVPTAPVGWLRAGGAPSWRTVITISMPKSVAGTPELCGAPGCQVDLTDVDLNLAELVLTTRRPEPGFQPERTATIDLRRVLNPELLPKSPLGEQLVPFAERLAPDLFTVDVGAPVRFAVTQLVRGILSTAAETGTVPVTSMALFSVVEPEMVGFASFEGGGSAGAPALRLVYTIANKVGLP